MLADSIDLQHGGFIGRHFGRHLGKGSVTKDHIGRHASFIGQTFAPNSQNVEQLVIVIKVADLRSPFLLQSFNPDARFGQD